MALLDDLGKFIQTPAGIGLLSAVAGGAMGARRGTPWNNMGRAATAGLLGYQSSQENQFASELKKMQMEEARAKLEERQALKQAGQSAFEGLNIDTPWLTEQGKLPTGMGQADLNAAIYPQLVKGGHFDAASKFAPKVQDPYTIGNTRFDANNQPVATVPKETETFGNVSPGDFTPASLEKFKVSGNYGDLVRQYAPTSGSGGNPYFNFIGTPAGIAVGDARTGNLRLGNIEGQPVVKSADDPALQGAIAGARVASEAGAKRAFNMTGLGVSVQKARDILSGTARDKGGVITTAPKPTGSYIGTGVDWMGKIVGASPEGSVQAQQLKAVAAALTSKMPRMEGPQSDRDVLLYQQAAAEVGDTTIPVDRRLAALDTVESLWAKYEGGGAPNQAPASPVTPTVVDW